MSVLVIAEVGSCHDGELGKALRLVEAARAAGADVAKFQFWSDADRLADRRRVPDAYRAIYRRYQMSQGWLALLRAACAGHMPALEDVKAAAARYGLKLDRLGPRVQQLVHHPELGDVGVRPIEFMATTYLPEDVATVAPFVKRFKISSFEAQDDAFLAAHHAFDKPVLISTGMVNEWDERTLAWMRGDNHDLLHCVSAYPAPVAAMNLAAIREHELQGLSDHSRDVRMGALAVAAGARIIEAHLRLDTTSTENPDYETAFSPVEFREYVRNIRFAEVALGDGTKRLQACEREMAAYRVTQG